MSTQQEKWITSGASRLKARQNRGFSYRAKQKASTRVSTITMEKKTISSKKDSGKRKRIVVGQTASSEVMLKDPYIHAAPSSDQGNECVPRGNRRIREVPTTFKPRVNQVDTSAMASMGTAHAVREINDRPADMTPADILAPFKAHQSGGHIFGSHNCSSLSVQSPHSTVSQQLHRLLSSASSGVMSQGINDPYALSGFVGVTRLQSNQPLSLNNLSRYSTGMSLPSLPESIVQDPLLKELLGAARTGAADRDAFLRSMFAGQQRNAPSLSSVHDYPKPTGIAKFQQETSLIPQSPSSTTSTLNSSEAKSFSTSSFPQAIRFYNDGLEVTVDGRAVGKAPTEVPVKKKRHRRTASDKAREEIKRKEELKNLEARQQSIWDAFALDDEEKQVETKKSEGDVENGMESSGNGETDQERENALNAASVLIALAPKLTQGS